MTMKVVRPARTSVPTLLPRACNWNHRSRVEVMNGAIVARALGRASLRVLRDVLHLVHKVPARGRRRQRPALAAIGLDRILDDPAQFKHGLFVLSVTAAVDQAWRAANVAAVLLGPLDDLYVPRAVLHFLDVAGRP